MLLLRITVVGCDRCPKEAEIFHEIAGSSNGPFNNALEAAGWGNPFCGPNGYLHLCPECKKKHYDKSLSNASQELNRLAEANKFVDCLYRGEIQVDTNRGTQDGDHISIPLRLTEKERS